MLQGKCVVLGVTGGIAAYKALEVTRILKKQGANVHVIMSEAACEFVGPLSFQTLSQNLVLRDMFAEPTNWDVEHIALADRADLFLICPATANIIAKMAAGIADDMLTTTLLASRAPIVLAPAMNVHMYENPITQKNLKYLESTGVHLIEPEEGLLACGYTGKGRLADPKKIVSSLKDILAHREDLKGLKILITAGPTQEPIDPVRFITNHSTGKMGYALAQQAADRGAKVTLISGPVSLPPPKNLTSFVQVVTAQDMLDAVLSTFDEVDVVIKAAAVADYTPAQQSQKKIKKSEDKSLLVLNRTEDILLKLGQMKTDQVLVGFAAETNDVLENAGGKLKEKNLDFIVVNDITEDGAGFGHDTNIIRILHNDKRVEIIPKMLKLDIANIILDRTLSYLDGRRGL